MENSNLSDMTTLEDDYDVSQLKKKKRINSRTKGNSFENRICKVLNERFNTEEFCRSPGSGAFGTTHKLPKHMRVHGDLITPEKFKHIVECKKGYKDKDLFDLFKPKSFLHQTIRQAEQDVRKSGADSFIIIWAKDRTKPLAIVNEFFFNIEEGLILDGKYLITTLENLLKLSDDYFFSKENLDSSSSE